MRPKIVLTIIGFAAVVVIALALIRNKHGEPNNSAVNANPAAAQPPTAVPPSTAPGRSTNALPDAARPGTTADQAAVAESGNPSKRKQMPASSSSARSLTHEEYVEQRVAELMDLGM